MRRKSVRTYEPIWILLKKDGIVRLVVEHKFYRRLKMAVTKEKWKDFEYNPKTRMILHFQKLFTPEGKEDGMQIKLVKDGIGLRVLRRDHVDVKDL